MKEICFLCHEEIITNLTWETLFVKQNPKKICSTCEGKIMVIKGNRCFRCGRPIEQRLCYDCVRWEKYFNGKDPLKYNVSLLKYNDFLQEVVTLWKYRGDYVIIEAFKELFKERFKKAFAQIKKPLLVPIPLSKERAMERGFNQAEQLAEFLPGEVCNIFKRVSSEKQAKKSRRERIRAKNPFELTETVNRPVILIDDLYTTGSTLRHASKLLKENNCPAVFAYTLIRG